VRQHSRQQAWALGSTVQMREPALSSSSSKGDLNKRADKPLTGVHRESSYFLSRLLVRATELAGR
jgi:hypothetical protein